MTVLSTVRVPTTNGSRYLQQLCKHWVTTSPSSSRRRKARSCFHEMPAAPTGQATRHCCHRQMATIWSAAWRASAEGQLTALKDAVARHIDRFAFREAPLKFDWTDA